MGNKASVALQNHYSGTRRKDNRHTDVPKRNKLGEPTPETAKSVSFEPPVRLNNVIGDVEGEPRTFG